MSVDFSQAIYFSDEILYESTFLKLINKIMVVHCQKIIRSSWFGKEEIEIKDGDFNSKFKLMLK